MADSQTIKTNVLKLQNARATPQDIEEYVKRATAEIDFKPLQAGTATQTAGPVPTSEGLRKEILPMAGSLLATEAKSTPVGMALSALGAGAGEAYNQLAQRFLPEKFKVIPGEPPETSGESVKRIASKAVTGALGEGLNRTVINPILGKIGNIIFPGADKATQAAVTTAEKEGIKTLPSMVSKSKAVAGTERALENMPFGTAITKFREKAVEDFGKFAERVGESISPKRAPEVNGALVKEAAKGFYDTFNEVKNKLYGSVLPQLKDKPVDVSNTLDAIQKLVESHSGEAQPALVNEAREWVQNVAGKKVPSQILDKFGKPFSKELSSTIKTYGELKKFATNIGNRTKFNDPSNPGMQGNLKQLWGAIQNDLDNAIEKYGDDSIKASLTKAKDYFSNGKAILENKIYNSLVSAPQGSEYKVAFALKDPMAYDVVKEVIGEDLMGGLSRQWFNDLLGQSTKNGITSPQLLLNKLDKTDVLIRKIAEDFPEAVSQIEKLKQVALLMTRNSDVMRGSQTFAQGSLMATLGELGASIGALFVNPNAGAAGLAAGLGVLGTSKAGTSVATSDLTRKVLSEGYPVLKPSVEKIVGTVTRPSSYLGISGMIDRYKGKK